MAKSLEDVIKDLEHVRSRPAMYFSPQDERSAENFLSGFAIGFYRENKPSQRDARWDVAAERGWRRSAEGPVPQTKKRGMSVREIIDELFAIEVEVARRYWAAPAEDIAPGAVPPTA